MKTKKNQTQVSTKEYIETYCQEKRIRKRLAVYVSPETHYRLKNTVRLFVREHHTTTSSLADSILYDKQLTQELCFDIQLPSQESALELAPYWDNLVWVYSS